MDWEQVTEEAEAEAEEEVGQIERHLTLRVLPRGCTWQNHQELRSILTTLHRSIRILRNRGRELDRHGQRVRMEMDQEEVGREISNHSVPRVRYRGEA